MNTRTETKRGSQSGRLTKRWAAREVIAMRRLASRRSRLESKLQQTNGSVRKEDITEENRKQTKSKRMGK